MSNGRTSFGVKRTQSIICQCQNTGNKFFINNTISEILELRNELSSAVAKFSTSCIETEGSGLTFFDVAEKITMLQGSSVYTKEIKEDILKLKENIDDNNDEQYEYKLNHVIQVKQDNNDDIIFDIGEYEFPSIEFFCNEDNQNGDFDSGTNLLSFQLKMENLNKTFSDSIQSEKFKFLELLIGNSKALMNNFQKIKTLEASLSLSNSFYDVSVGLVFNVEFDAITLMAVFNKISALLKNIISYKIRVEHKFKTILSYFEPISDDIIATLSPKKKDSGGCIIF